MNLFDICIITTSSPRRAAAVRALLDRRIEHGLYPREIDFRVYGDPQGSHPGSAGATLLALDALTRDLREKSIFEKKKILVINAGGPNRGLPCFAPESKLFVPLPLDSSSVIPPVVLDVQLALFLKYPWRDGETLIASADAVVDFDADTLPFDRSDLCGFALPADTTLGAQHGVFRFDATGRSIEDYFQKQTSEFLRSNALIEGTSECALDAGIIAVSASFIKEFLSFGRSRRAGLTLLHALVSDKAGFDWYLEIMTAALNGMTETEFHRRMDGRSRLDPATRRALFETFRRFPLRAARTSRSTFIPVGRIGSFIANVRELNRRGLRPFYSRTGEEVRSYASDSLIEYNSTGVEIPLLDAKTVLVEATTFSKLENPMGGNIISGADGLRYETALPPNICIDHRQIEGATIRCAYGTTDSFDAGISLEKTIFCGLPLVRWIEERGLTSADLWDDENHRCLQSARLFCSGVDDDFITGYWSSVGLSAEWRGIFKAAKRYSLATLNSIDDPLAREERRMANRAAQLKARVANGTGWRSLSVTDLSRAFVSKPEQDELQKNADVTDDMQLAAYRRAHCMAMGIEIARSARSVRPGSLSADNRLHSLALKKPAVSNVMVTAPVRLDIAGGWSDTPPFAFSQGGAVVNCAVTINGKQPVSVAIKRIPERRILLRLAGERTIETIGSFDDLGNLETGIMPFGILCGVLKTAGFSDSSAPSLDALLKRSGGFEITVGIGVPAGSGLGLSSILCASAVTTLARYYGLAFDLQQTVEITMAIEQQLGIGGGWQDMVGGIVGGVNYITSAAGTRPKLDVYHLDPHLFASRESSGLFTLYHTGITRSCRTMLADVVQRMHENRPATRFTLEHVSQLAADGRDAIERRDLRKLGNVLSHSQRANELLHPAATSPALEKILTKAGSVSLGGKLAGAGGGGYALFVSDNAKDAKKLGSIVSKAGSKGGKIVRWGLSKTGMTIKVR